MTINVLIGGSLPRLLRDIVQALVHDEPDLRVTAVGPGTGELLDHLGTQPADVVIIGCDKTLMDEISHSVLERSHRARVIAVTASDCNAVLYRLRPVSRRLGCLATDTLLKAIRENGSEAAAGRPRVQ